MSERLLHYSDDPIVVAYAVPQEDLRSKPRGLWVSVEGADDWRSWCEAEGYGNPAEQYCYQVTLKPAAKVLRLKTTAEILGFAKKYNADPYFGRIPTMMSGYGVDWPAVAEKYDGIIIAPYNWNLRLDNRTHWYYGWDCASGCIWNAPAAIKSITPLTEKPASRVPAVVQESEK